MPSRRDIRAVAFAIGLAPSLVAERYRRFLATACNFRMDILDNFMHFCDVRC